MMKRCHSYHCWLQSCFRGDQSECMVKPVPRQTSAGSRTVLLGLRVGRRLETALLFLAGQTLAAWMSSVGPQSCSDCPCCVCPNNVLGKQDSVTVHFAVGRWRSGGKESIVSKVFKLLPSERSRCAPGSSTQVKTTVPHPQCSSAGKNHCTTSLVFQCR